MIVFASTLRLNDPSVCALTFLTSLLIAREVLIIEGEVMKTPNTMTKLIAITMAVAVLVAVVCLAGSLQPVEAQIADGSVRFVSYASAGIVHGERVRLSVSNTEESAGHDRPDCKPTRISVDTRWG